MRGIGEACAATSGAEPTLSKTRPSSLATFVSAASTPDCAGTIQEPAGYSVAPTLNAFSAIVTSNADNRNRAASSASCPVSLSRKTGPEPETLPTAIGAAVTGFNGAETIFSSSMRLASRP